MRTPSREFCWLWRNSLRCPVVVFRNGMLPKLLPMPAPLLVLRHTAVKSAKPTGMIVTLPNLSCNGDDSGSLGWGCALAGTTGEPIDGRRPGIIGVVLATSPTMRVEPLGASA